MKDELERLIDATRGCRDDMHEPDDQGVRAITTGWVLDNAMGEDPRDNHGEMTIGIVRDDCEPEWFNLATIIALARKAKL